MTFRGHLFCNDCLGLSQWVTACYPMPEIDCRRGMRTVSWEGENTIPEYGVSLAGTGIVVL